MCTSKVELPGIEAAYNDADQRKQKMRQHGATWENMNQYELCADHRQHTQP
jgi:hypothetical protein